MHVEHLPISKIPQLVPSQPSAELQPAGPGFADVLQNAVEQVNGLQQQADTAARAFAVGQASSVHDTMIALEKADLSLRLVTQVRNKAVEAYQKIMRMPI